jgi:hypothetical protein
MGVTTVEAKNSVILVFPIGPVWPVDNAYYQSTGTVTVVGYVMNGAAAMPALGKRIGLVAKVYPGRPYTLETLPPTPPDQVSLEGAIESTNGTFTLEDLPGPLCSGVLPYTENQLVIWFQEVDGGDYTGRKICDFQGQTIRPTYRMPMPRRPGMP